jgi:rhodanese-related sulfurtransferase
MLGTIAFGLGWPWLEGFYESGAMGRVRLDQYFQIPFGVLAAGVVAMAVGAFFGVEQLEAFLARRRGTEAPDRAPRLRNAALAGIAVVAALGIFGKATPAAQAAAEPGSISALELATRIVEDPRGMWIVDLRDPAACAAGSLPGAQCRPADDADARFVADLPASRALVLVVDKGSPLPEVVRAWTGPVYLLDGGYAAFKDVALTAPVLPAEPTLAQIDDYQRRSALFSRFSGAGAPAAAPVAVKRAAAGTAAKKGGGC